MKEQAASRNRALQVGLVVAISLHAFEQVAVVAILDDVVRELDGRHLSGLLFGAYLTATMFAMIITGEWLDRGVYAAPMVVGLSLFAAGLLVAALAPDIVTLLSSRVLQGLGGGVLQTVAFGAVNRAFDDRERPRVLSYLSQAWVIPGIVGPALAGALAQAVHWRAVFAVVLVTIPVVPIFALGALRSLEGRETISAGASPIRQASSNVHRSLLPEAFLFAATFFAALLGLSTGRKLWPDFVFTAGAFAFAALCLARLLPRGVFAFSRGLPTAIVLLFVVFFAFFGADSFLPMALKQLHGWNTFQSALALTPAAVFWAVAAVVMARVKRDEVGAIRLGFVGLGIGVAGSIGVAYGSYPPWVAFPTWALAGFGIGIVHLGLTAVAMRLTVPGREGATAAAVSLVTSLGFALSAGVVGAFVGSASEFAHEADPFALGWMIGLLSSLVGAATVGRLYARRRILS